MDVALNTGSLCVVTSYPEVNAEWCVSELLNDGVIVGFSRKPAVSPPRKCLDLSDKIFSPRFALPDIVTETTGATAVGLIYPDILVQSDRFTADDLLDVVNTLLVRGQTVVIVCNISTALLNENYPIGREQNRLVTALLHKCHTSVSARPFKTGRADDTTGVVIIGPGPRADKREILDYVYTVKTNGKVAVVPRAST